MRRQALLALVMLGILLLGTGCNGEGASLTLAEDRPNLLFFHAEF